MRYPMQGRCGCGANGHVFKMTDRLWDELFSGPGERPEHVAICLGSCRTEAERFGSPLERVYVEERKVADTKPVEVSLSRITGYVIGQPMPEQDEYVLNVRLNDGSREDIRVPLTPEQVALLVTGISVTTVADFSRIERTTS